MPRYELVSPVPHYERNGRVMKQGDVIETDENYEKKWAGKFVETLKPVTDFDEEKVEVQVRDKKSKLVNKQTPVDEADAQRRAKPAQEIAPGLRGAETASRPFPCGLRLREKDRASSHRLAA